MKGTATSPHPNVYIVARRIIYLDNANIWAFSRMIWTQLSVILNANSDLQISGAVHSKCLIHQLHLKILEVVYVLLHRWGCSRNVPLIEGHNRQVF